MNPEYILIPLWCIAAMIQLSYWIFPRIPREPPKDEEPWVSVIICIHRSSFLLQRLITQLQVQTYERFEVVIVNDGPNPEIDLYLNTVHWDKVKNISFNKSEKLVQGKKAPLTAGIAAAQHSWLLMTDADCVPGPNWIRSMVDSRSKSTVMVLGFAPFFRHPSLRNMLQRLDALIIAIQYFGAALRGSPYMGVGRNLMYKRALFDTVGGFKKHAHLASGDDDLLIQSARKMQSTICIDPDSFVHSEAEASWPAWYHQKRRHLSASRAYLPYAKVRSTLFAATWLITWIGFVVFILMGTIAIPVLLILIQWLLFGNAAWKLRHRELVPLFPLLAVLYCGVLLTIAVILLQKPLREWSPS